MDIGTYLIKTPTTGRFRVRPAAAPEDRSHFLVGFHGYGESAEKHFAELEQIPGAGRWTIVAVFALHRFYTKSNDVVGSWMTRLDRDEAIADNLRYTDEVVSDVHTRVGAPSKLVYAGFSQGVAMAYRAAARGAHACDGVIALCGDVPPELRQGAWLRSPRVLVGRGRDDKWYTGDKLADDLKSLAAQPAQVDYFEFDGGHAWTDEFRARAGRFLASLLAAGRVVA
jgi:predicted esterase